MCDCCEIEREHPGFRRFNPACLWCGARYLQAVGSILLTKQKRTEWRLKILDDWTAIGHDREELRTLAKGETTPIAPVESKPKKRARK